MNEFEVDFGEAEPPVWPEGVAAVGPGDYQTTLVHFPFRKRIQGLPESVGITIFVFDTLGDRHTVLGTFEEPGRLPYEVVFNQFEPDFLYFLELQPSPDGQYEQLLNFMKLGVEHIFIGYDHILFLLALVVVSRFKTLLAVITSFTAAHTITLILAALEVVWLPTRLIETAIAATIMYVAVENLYVKEPKRRWMLTFAFGLVHGFGFANVLRETGLPPTGLVRCLVSFNVGVELGQLAIVAAVWPLWRLVAKQKWGQRVTQVVGVGILLFGLAWFLDRALGLRMMPI
jgi:hydrogenase/urease accessory protein HupE